MSKKAHPTIIGAFVVGALALAIAGILIFGSGQLFQKSTPYVLYFDSSIGGLDVGAPVEFSGVRIGNVSDIQLIYDHKDDTMRIPIFIRIDRRRMSEANAEVATPGGMGLHIERGLRARLQSQSFLTGKLKIELAYLPDTPVAFSGQHHDVMEIPTAPSTLQALTKKFDDLPIAQIVLETHRTVQGLGDLVESEAVRDAAGNLNEAIIEVRALAKNASEMIDEARSKDTLDTINATLDELQSLMAELEDSVTSIAGSFAQVSDAASGAMGAVEVTLTEVTELIDDDSALSHDVGVAAQELTRAARKIAALADLLERHPESLIHGKKQP